MLLSREGVIFFSSEKCRCYRISSKSDDGTATTIKSKGSRNNSLIIENPDAHLSQVAELPQGGQTRGSRVTLFTLGSDHT